MWDGKVGMNITCGLFREHPKWIMVVATQPHFILSSESPTIVIWRVSLVLSEQTYIVYPLHLKNVSIRYFPTRGGTVWDGLCI